MITLREFFDILSSSELSQVSFGSPFDGGIKDKDRSIIIPLINMGLADIYSQLNIKTKSAIIRTIPFKTSYRITSKHTIGSDAEEAYIYSPSHDPFIDDIIKIESCFDECGEEFPINRPDNKNSVYLSEFNKLEIPFIEDMIRVITIHYKAKHPEVPIDTRVADSGELIMEIPSYCVNALSMFVGAKSRKGLNSSNTQTSLRYNDLNLYQQEIQKIMSLNLIPEEHVVCRRYEMTGLP